MKKLVLGLLPFLVMACVSDIDDYSTTEQLEIDVERIDTHLYANNIDAQIAPSGIRYVINDVGNGTYPTEGQTVTVDYELWRFTGELVDTSKEDLAVSENIYNRQREYVPLEFELGNSSFIPGFQLSVLLLDEGGEGDFYVPSVLAYRNVGTSIISPNENVYFKIRLIDVHQK